MTARDAEIERVTNAVERYRVAMDTIKWGHRERGGDQGAHEHDAEWLALAAKLERTRPWLCVLLRKRGLPDDLVLARGVAIGMWP